VGPSSLLVVGVAVVEAVRMRLRIGSDSDLSGRFVTDFGILRCVKEGQEQKKPENRNTVLMWSVRALSIRPRPPTADLTVLIPNNLDFPICFLFYGSHD
jgi:hypothetical protein